MKKDFIIIFLLLITLSGCVSETTQSEPTTPDTSNKEEDDKPIKPEPPDTSPPETTAPTTTTTKPPQKTPKPQPPNPDNYELVKIASGFSNPLYLTHAGDGSGRLFIAEQEGIVKIIDKTLTTLNTPFLDISSNVRSGGERGLLGLAFHPKYTENGLFYVHYSDSNGDTVISRFKVSDNPNKADKDSEETLLTQKQPYSNHNGGQIAFGPDGLLYIGLGDGGSGGDPMGNGQNPSTLLGTILRINVDREKPYTIPQSNPFTDSQEARPEVWAYGLRNPWRFSFDRLTGDLYIGDVGQNKWEEINYQPANSPGGENYGWNQMEGNNCHIEGCNSKAYTQPVAEYSHADGCSITGGYVYRGALDNNLYGTYVYGDYCSGLTWALLKSDEGKWINKVWLKTSLEISSFGEDEAGEIYVIDHGGSVYQIKKTA